MEKDKTFGVKASLETIERANQMIEVSGLSKKEWFESAVSMLELESAKKGPIGYKVEITELERHTQRINELFIHVIQRASFTQDETLRDLQQLKEQQEEIQRQRETEIQELKGEIQDRHAVAEQAVTEKEVVERQLEELRQANTDLRELIEGYKEKIDTLSGLVNEYKADHEENKTLQNKAGEERERQEALSVEVDQLKKQLRDLRKQKDLTRQRALLRQEKAYQKQIREAQEKYNQQIKALLDRINAGG